ncbi:4197_t:CDS:2 [Diversispora eburnea]|uniref:4197_t:CDS:1 n=1 Tax=Diversispora eburnea TaxID=1213867 RepID=A0A9N9F7P2_9GLOM|nr:4197_t:CDS:2 [Diversispora eburnea]
MYFSQTPSCIITFTGWILEYSMIYVIDYNSINSVENINSVEDTNSENFKNCLGNQDLKLVQVFLSSNKSNMKIQRHLLLSFSFPINLKPRRGYRISTISVELLSINKLIDNLKSKFNNRLKNQDIWNKEIEIEISDVCLPIIAL